MGAPGFDSLTHLDDPRLAGELDRIAREARDGGIGGWLVAAGDPDRWPEVRAAASATGGVLALGAHPWWTADAPASRIEAWVAALEAADPPVVGEIGLDRLHAGSDAAWDRQVAALRAQLAWARDRDRPVVLHVVRAIPELLAWIRRDGLPAAGGAIHGWAGPPHLAEEAVAHGLHVSVGPLVLQPSGHKVRASVLAIPRERLLLETDCPAQEIPGAPLAGPLHTRVVAEAVAGLWHADVDVVLEATGTAARALWIGRGAARDAG